MQLTNQWWSWECANRAIAQAPPKREGPPSKRIIVLNVKNKFYINLNHINKISFSFFF